MVDLGEQHDDHIWMTFWGEAWAIERIEDESLFLLWRGYEPEIERTMAKWPKECWVYYAEYAALQLKGRP